MKKIPPHIRPRERAWESGISSLSDAELVAIVLRNGTTKHSVLEQAHHILADAEGNLHELWKQDSSSLHRKKILGKVQVVTLQAALELGHRMHMVSRSPHTYEEALQEITHAIRLLEEEMFYLIFLDLRNKCIGNPLPLRKGTRYYVGVEPREIVSLAVQRGAARMVMVHNHPSGNPSPSPNDILLTKQVLEGLHWMDIHLLDHCIVSRNDCFSMREKGMLD